MKNRHLLVALALGLGLTMAVLWLLGNPPAPVTAAAARRARQEQGDVLTVCLSGDCNYDTIQAAVDAADAGDVIKVAAGTYTDLSVRPRDDYTTTGVVTQVVYISKTVTIRGGYTTTNWIASDPKANPTTLDAQREGRGIYVTGDITPTIEGLRITKGDADGLDGWYLQGSGAGGGIYAITATIRISNCQIYSNASGAWGWGGGVFLLYSSDATLTGNSVLSNTNQDWRGGGIAVSNGSAILRDNVIRGNFAGAEGGGVYLLYADDTVLDGNTIISNTAGDGGGVFCYATNGSQFRNNIIQNNKAESSSYVLGGGGMALITCIGCDTVLDGNIISNNTAGYGGGLGAHGSDSTITLTNNIISGNTADQAGGGVYAYGFGEARLFNTVIADNRADIGSGAYIWDGSNFQSFHTTLARNVGSHSSGIRVATDWDGRSTIALTNTILVSHSVGISVAGGNTVTVNAILWDSNTPVTVSKSVKAVVDVHNQYIGNPAFAPDGHHLMPHSAAIDRGLGTSIVTDIDGDPRPAPAGTRPDLGADEIDQQQIYLPLIMRET